ncbi:MAG: hypothetical protein Ct9H300mP1_22530 [Planctomycetaceae bacterium]|nr:MAG: hypothetical protein Ct9H300mP1_22530 [Planctomycetaceae bacterium]
MAEGGRAGIGQDRASPPVYRLELPDDPSGTSLYIKRYRAADWKARWRRLARGATSRREYRGMVAVADLGVPTAQVVAIGGPLWPGHDRDSWLVTVGVPEPGAARRVAVRQRSPHRTGSRAGSGEPGRRDPRTTPRRRNLARRSAAGNFLVQSWDGERPRVVLIDLHPPLKIPPDHRPAAEGAGPGLASAFGSSVTPSEGWVFLQKYMEASVAVAFDEVTRRNGPRPWRPCSVVVANGCGGGWPGHWARGNRRLLIADSAEATCRGLVFLGQGQSNISESACRGFHP